MGLPREHRLRARDTIRAVARRGRRLTSPLGVLSWLPGETDASRLGLVLGRRLGSAVRRNRLRRRLHEHFRRLAPSLSPPRDLLLRLAPPAMGLSFEALGDEFARLLGRVGAIRP